MRRGTDTQTAVTNIHFASATPHAKCNKASLLMATTSETSTALLSVSEAEAEETYTSDVSGSITLATFFFLFLSSPQVQLVDLQNAVNFPNGSAGESRRLKLRFRWPTRT